MRKPTTPPQAPTQTSAPAVMDTVARIVRNACCIFAGCSFALILIQWAISGSIDDAIIAVDAFLLLYPLSLGISAANLVRRSETLPVWGKCILHPVLCLGGIFLAYLPYMTRNQFPAGTVGVHLFAFAVAYGVGTAVACLISIVLRSRRGRSDKSGKGGDTQMSGGKSKKQPEAYTPVFKKRDDE